ncbi:hypothetical protein [Rudanella lutea]|uniref:hypothetical protein n=1 Tax=Rudanella lutea TaxID=451374 RepID=UPI00037A1027|nr:hypothetical protein [Rudanella lutea]
MYHDPLLPGRYYHLFNHAVGDENLFRYHDNYIYFLKQYAAYIQPVARTFTYCLMPNHFHFLVQIADEAEIEHCFQTIKPEEAKPVSFNHSSFVVQQFSNLCNSYAKAYNKRFNRRGSLFIDKLKRKEVDSDTYFTRLIAYIHTNPVHHGFCQKAELWSYSSLTSVTSSKPTLLERNTVLDWFGGVESFVAFHQQIQPTQKGEDWEFGY